jgi:hypothetical protein
MVKFDASYYFNPLLIPPLSPLFKAGLFHSKLKIAGVDGVKGLWGGGERIFLR